LTRRVQAIQVRHPDVQDHYVGFQLRGLVDRIAAIDGFAADLPSWMPLQKRAQTVSYNLVIVRNQDTQF
jgi:hypothetical protein